MTGGQLRITRGQAGAVRGDDFQRRKAKNPSRKRGVDIKKKVEEFCYLLGGASITGWSHGKK